MTNLKGHQLRNSAYRPPSRHKRWKRHERTPPQKLSHLIGEDTTANRNRASQALRDAQESLATLSNITAPVREVATFMLNCALRLPAKGRLGDLMKGALIDTQKRFASTDRDVVYKGIGIAFTRFRVHLDALLQESSPT